MDDTQVQDFGKKRRPDMRDVCKVALDAVNQASNSCPIILTSFTFNIFFHYLTTRRKQNQSYLEKSTYGGIQSSLGHLFRMSGKQMSKMMAREMSQFMSGIQRTVVSEKISEGGSINEGKHPMILQTYERCVNYCILGKTMSASFHTHFLPWSVIS